MSYFLNLAAAALLGTSVVADASVDVPAGMVRFPMERLGSTRLSRRASEGAVDGIISNMKSYYALRCAVGTPAQDLRLVLDTGSSDFWVMSPDTEECKAGKCQQGSIFDTGKSKSFHNNGTQFRQQYADSTSASGTWAQDVFTMGDVKIDNFNFAVASHANSSQTVAGIGLAKGETPYVLQEISTPYENLPMQLKSSGYISHVAYSLYLDNYSDGVGHVLFGGVNKGAYEGDLYVFPLVPVDTDEIDRLAIKLDSIYLMDNNGDQQMVASTSFPVVFDSGSTISSFPVSVIDPIMTSIGAEYYQGMYLIECDALENNHGGIGFTFGNVEYVINFRDLLVEMAEGEGVRVCAPGFIPGGSIPLFGDNIIRALYVVYDLENKELGIAKANTASSISTDYETIGSSIPGTRAPGYSNSDVAWSIDSYPITLFSNSAQQVSFSLSSDVSESVGFTSSGSFSGSATSASSAQNDVSVTIGGKDSSSGLASPYGGFGSGTAKEVRTTGGVVGAGNNNNNNNNQQSGSSSGQAAAATNSGASSSASSSSSSSHKSKNIGSKNAGALGGLLAGAAGLFLMLI